VTFGQIGNPQAGIVDINITSPNGGGGGRDGETILSKHGTKTLRFLVFFFIIYFLLFIYFNIFLVKLVLRRVHRQSNPPCFTDFGFRVLSFESNHSHLNSYLPSILASFPSMLASSLVTFFLSSPCTAYFPNHPLSSVSITWQCLTASKRLDITKIVLDNLLACFY